MKFRDYFSNDFETAEDHYLPELKTKYYRSRNEEAKAAVIKLVELEKGYVKAISDTHHEVFFQCSDYSCIATIISTRPTETAIDLKITTNSPFPRGKGRKIIIRLYEYLDKKLPYKGAGLYRN
jgi:hypothetical protein